MKILSTFTQVGCLRLETAYNQFMITSYVEAFFFIMCFKLPINVDSFNFRQAWSFYWEHCYSISVVALPFKSRNPAEFFSWIKKRSVKNCNSFLLLTKAALMANYSVYYLLLFIFLQCKIYRKKWKKSSVEFASGISQL